MGCESPSMDTGKGKNLHGSGTRWSYNWTKDERNKIPVDSTDAVIVRRRVSRRHGYSRRSEDRLKNLERKVSLLTQRRITLLDARRVAYEKGEWLMINLNKRIKSLEKNQVDLSRRIVNMNENANENAISMKRIGESVGSRLTGSLRTLEEIVETNNSAIKEELARLAVNAARKAAELSLTREELSNLRRAVQALSVSASKLQEKNDRQQEAMDRLNRSCFNEFTRGAAASPFKSGSKSESDSPSVVNGSELEIELEPKLEQFEDRYHLIVEKLPTSCQEQSTDHSSKDGLRLVDTGQGRKPIMVYCRDGWLVVGRRIDGTLDFNRSWNDYSLGFGSPVGEYWIGNQILHDFTRDNCTRLRVDMLDIYGERWQAEYELFAITSGETGYRLLIDGYTGNATDALSYQNGMPFSAKDRDMDDSVAHCAANYHGGWWFNRCQHANLNGKYSLGLTWFRSDTDQWMSIATSEMSVRRNSDCCRSR